jgi:hypothetical protein
MNSSSPLGAQMSSTEGEDLGMWFLLISLGHQCASLISRPLGHHEWRMSELSLISSSFSLSTS